MKEELISIIVPVYKVEKYLTKCVESIVNQTYKNLEIILVDDGSPDTCPKLCDELAKTDSRIKVIHKENGGLSDARNAGIDIATGEYLMFVDSDDYIDRTICEKLYYLLTENNADFSMCDAVRFFEDEEPHSLVQNVNIKTFEGKNVLNQLFYADSDYLVVAWGKLYKKNLFKEVRYPKGKLHEDVYVLHQILAQTDKFVYTNEQLYNYLQRSSSIMSSFTEKNYLHTYQAYLERYEFFKERKDKFSEQDNNTHMLGNLRNLYCRARADKFDIKNEILNTYKEIYKNTAKKSWKEVIFRRFFWIYLLLIKIKGN